MEIGVGNRGELFDQNNQSKLVWLDTMARANRSS
jgi:hypothetical protein